MRTRMSSHMTSPLPHSIGNFFRRQRLGFSFSDSRLGATRRFERLAPRATRRLCQPWPWLGASRIRCPAVSGTETPGRTGRPSVGLWESSVREERSDSSGTPATDKSSPASAASAGGCGLGGVDGSAAAAGRGRQRRVAAPGPWGPGL